MKKIKSIMSRLSLAVILISMTACAVPSTSDVAEGDIKKIRSIISTSIRKSQKR